ncbi:uncharacterized protein LY89DRAFT_580475 [Mollisia scopiformis]|uniref:WHIM1 domain-containing protein n=1 Tax=Mollisia scopiformis TaxID=149040 RepID=A0A194XJC6_MOLSC|nr:uncharacterized protein LY89DRAFT_580475 [Mollisia scopiformis]KUJ19862.1 hypothetical protein LY89DRAFT_580475 [Mollisia scopiformis]
MASDSDSELSDVPSDVENDLQLTKKDGILKFFSKQSAAPKQAESPPRAKREPSPPHEYVLADNQDIAFIVMYRSRFTEVFPKSLINFGPQELERDVVDPVPGEGVEHFLCALLGLLLNRKQDVKAGHYGRALEDAIQLHKSQWPKEWEAKNPLSGGVTFTSMSPTERLTLLRALILWSLSSSDAVKALIASSYKQTRREDDLNQPLSVQPWGSDSDKRRYYLIEGLDDTHFRVYRESNYMGIKRTWWSVASDIDELKGLAEKLNKEDGGQKAKLLSTRITAAIPRFEATEDKRKRREYRQIRKHQFKRNDLGTSLYEGRTRGKRVRYNYSDEDPEGIYSDATATTTRRSTRNTGTHTPVESGPTITQSGRQVKSRQGGAYGETMLSSAHPPAGSYAGTSEEPENELEAGSRPRRAAANHGTNGYPKPKGGRHIEGYNDVDEMTSDDEGDASEQDYGDDEEEDEQVSLASDGDDQDDRSEEDEEMEDAEPKKLIVKLMVKTPTPEKKTIIKLRVSPEKDRDPNAKGLFLNTNTKENVQPASSGESSEPASKMTGMAPNSPQPVKSPLAFRGSPEKPTTFMPAIDVGYRGS